MVIMILIIKSLYKPSISLHIQMEHKWLVPDTNSCVTCSTDTDSHMTFVLCIRNNTGGNKLIILSSIALYYYCRTQKTTPERVQMYGRRLTTQQWDERWQDNGDKKQLACQHSSYLLRSLTRRHLDSTSSFALSTCSVWGTWCACIYLV